METKQFLENSVTPENVALHADTCSAFPKISPRGLTVVLGVALSFISGSV